MEIINKLKNYKGENLSDSSKKEYKSKLNKINSLNIDYFANEEDIIKKIEDLDELINNKLSYLNVCIVLRKYLNMSIESLKKWRSSTILKSKNEVTHTNMVDKKKGLPDIKEIYKYTNELYAQKKYKKYIINFLLIATSCRNKDLYLVVKHKDNKLIDLNTNYLIIHNDKVEFIRNVYKTSYKYGTKNHIITNKNFIDACKSFLDTSEQKMLLNNYDNIASEVRSITYNNIGQGRMNKIIMNNTTKSELIKLSKSRGTSLNVLLENYDLNRVF